MGMVPHSAKLSFEGSRTGVAGDATAERVAGCCFPISMTHVTGIKKIILDYIPRRCIFPQSLLTEGVFRRRSVGGAGTAAPADVLRKHVSGRRRVTVRPN
jgi:hypothetical protein